MENSKNIIKICHSFTDYKLISDNPGQQKYWDELMKELENNIFSVLCFNMPMETNTAAYFTNTTGFRNTFDCICCPENIAIIDLQNKTVKFNSEHDFAVFVHETCHWKHLVRDKGICTAKGLNGKIYTSKDTDPVHRRDIEYEAGWRAIVLDNLYHLFEPRMSLNINLINIFTYDVKNVPEDTLKEFKELIKDIDKNIYIKILIDSFISKIEKFSDWSDPKHELDISELMEAIKNYKNEQK